MEQKLSKLLRSSKTFLLEPLVFLALSSPVSVALSSLSLALSRSIVSSRRFHPLLVSLSDCESVGKIRA